MHTVLSAVQFLGRPDRWDGAVYIGMPGKAARAFGIDDRFGLFGKPWWTLNDSRGWEVAYREYLFRRIRTDGDFALAVRDLHGKTLLCWCRAKGAAVACHGDTLIAASEWLFHGIADMRDGHIPPGAEGGPVFAKCVYCANTAQADDPRCARCARNEDAAESYDPNDLPDLPWYIDPAGYDIRYER